MPSAKKKDHISPEGRENIAKAQRKRWREYRRKQKKAA